MLKRRQLKISMGENLYLYKVIYEYDYDTEAFSRDGLTAQWNLISSVGTTPELMNIGGGKCDSLKLYYNGTKWIIEIQKEVEE